MPGCKNDAGNLHNARPACAQPRTAQAHLEMPESGEILQRQFSDVVVLCNLNDRLGRRRKRPVSALTLQAAIGLVRGNLLRNSGAPVRLCDPPSCSVCLDIAGKRRSSAKFSDHSEEDEGLSGLGVFVSHGVRFRGLGSSLDFDQGSGS